jgi:hypothetical protein
LRISQATTSKDTITPTAATISAMLANSASVIIAPRNPADYSSKRATPWIFSLIRIDAPNEAVEKLYRILLQ